LTTDRSVLPFDLLTTLYADREMAQIFSEERTVDGWLQTESALASVQGGLGVIPVAAAAAIVDVCHSAAMVNTGELWTTARTVGYPILGLVRQIDDALPETLRGNVHFGATTQDIMDTGLVIQLRNAVDLLLTRVVAIGVALATLVERYAECVMAGRTHGQQSTPITFGAKLAVFLCEFSRHYKRLNELRPQLISVSLFGASGTAAAFGPKAAEIRAGVAARLGLSTVDVPWHVARDNIAHLAHCAAATATSCGRIAKEIIDLARTEIGEVRETGGAHRGASSTMPQKANPITSESIRGFAIAANALAAGSDRFADISHERASGEWQAEWTLVPMLLVHTASAATLTGELLTNLRVDEGAMRANLDAEGGLIMAEAAMIKLAQALGRERAHDVVYELAQTTRTQRITLPDALRQWCDENPEFAAGVLTVEPAEYIGDAVHTCRAAVAHWQETTMGASRIDTSTGAR
jgi:3-carboxy-cis,cis-muconate cycloisomerase